MYLAGGQLFSGPDLKHFLADRQEEAEAAIAALTPEDFAARSEAALESMLMSRFRMPEGHLLAEDSYFAEERELTVAEANLPTEGLPSEGGDPYPPDAILKSVTIAIPFRGHSALFTHRPNVFSAHQPEADVVGQELHIGFIVAPEEEWMIQHRFQQHIALIERTLEVTQWQAMDFNSQLLDRIRTLLRARKAALGQG
jgi:hypothetical protein